MEKQLHKHCDCRNFAPVDVVKGICHRTKDLIMGDDQQCGHFTPVNKCKLCGHYSASDEEFMGICNAEAAKPWTYPDMITTTCEMFKA
jgi:4-hydroxyphenylacetate decarboxylase small subunit